MPEKTLSTIVITCRHVCHPPSLPLYNSSPAVCTNDPTLSGMDLLTYHFWTVTISPRDTEISSFNICFQQLCVSTEEGNNNQVSSGTCPSALLKNEPFVASQSEPGQRASFRGVRIFLLETKFILVGFCSLSFNCREFSLSFVSGVAGHICCGLLVVVNLFIFVEVGLFWASIFR